ncbi:uncharacterized protein [Erythrolamprus reginae]|uniref:uncharacterized protein isoform X2 n=2 Tax=Erythrolamprus reginae TaxID=121349 RepID=UPI00396C37D8
MKEGKATGGKGAENDRLPRRGCREMVRGWAQSSRMQLAGLFVVGILSLASLRESRVEASRDHPANVHPKHKKKTLASLEDAWREEQDKERGFREQIVRRAVRKYPEDAADHGGAGHRQISVPMGRAEGGSCPEVLAKGTLAVIVAALAFLGFFSTSVLLVVAVYILRVVNKQRKTGKEGRPSYPSPRRPPIPPPRPERTYITMKPPGSDHLQPAATPRTAEDTYLSVNELNPGPRTRQKPPYQSVSASTPPKTPMEREYLVPEKVQPFSSPPSAKKYLNVEEAGPTPVTGGSPETGMTPQGRDNHIYEEVE